jgi:hypothetical protein
VGADLPVSFVFHQRDRRPFSMLPVSSVVNQPPASPILWFPPQRSQRSQRKSKRLLCVLCVLCGESTVCFTDSLVSPQRSQRSQRKSKRLLCVLCVLCGESTACFTDSLVSTTETTEITEPNRNVFSVRSVSSVLNQRALDVLCGESTAYFNATILSTMAAGNRPDFARRGVSSRQGGCSANARSNRGSASSTRSMFTSETAVQ